MDFGRASAVLGILAGERNDLAVGARACDGYLCHWGGYGAQGYVGVDRWFLCICGLFYRIAVNGD